MTLTVTSSLLKVLFGYFLNLDTTFHKEYVGVSIWFISITINWYLFFIIWVFHFAYESTCACFCQVPLTKTNHTDRKNVDDCYSLFA